MRKLPAIAAIFAATIAGTAVAASRNSHVIEVPLLDGSTARVEYVGNVAPKVSIEPQEASAGDWLSLPQFASFDEMMAEMNRDSVAMMRQAQQIAGRPPAVGNSPYVASFGKIPEGMTSETVVSYSNGSQTCTRTTETVSQGPNKPPRVTSRVSGNCAATANPEPSAPISRT